MLFDPRGYDEDWRSEFTEQNLKAYLSKFDAPIIEEGWLATGHYEDEGSKRIFNGLVKAMRRRFASHKGNLFGQTAYARIIEDGWAFGQHGPLNNEEGWDISEAKKPKLWKS